MAASVLQETASTFNSGSASSVTVEFANDCTPGSTIEVWIGDDSGVTPSSVSDGVNGSYTAGASITDTGSGEWCQFLYYFVNQSSSTTLTITVDFPSDVTYSGVVIKEIGGVTSSPYQTSSMVARLEPGTGAGAITGGSVTPSSQPCLLSSFCFDFAGTAETSPANGTLGQYCWAYNSVDVGTTQSRVLTSTSATNSTWTNATDGASNYFIVGDVVWTASSGESAPTITAQPTSEYCASGGTDTFSVTATDSDDGADITYQWYYGATQGVTAPPPSSFTEIGGATSSSYTTGDLTASNNGDWYYVVCTNSYGSVTSTLVRSWITGLGSAGQGRGLGTSWPWRINLGPTPDKIARKVIDATNVADSAAIYPAFATYFFGTIAPPTPSGQPFLPLLGVGA